MGFGHALAFENRRYECCSEAVAGADCIGHFYYGCRLERYLSGGEYIAAVDTAGEDEHFEIVLAEENPAFVLKVNARVAEHAAYGDKFFVVDF